MIKISSRIEPIIKPKIKIPTLNIFNNKLGRLVTSHINDEYNPNWIKTEVKNAFGKSLGYELYSFNNESGKACGATMQVEKEYRQRGFKIGEILRLSSIIGIMENKTHEFEIHSKPSAVYFHSKYKFEPAITQFQERDNTLLAIIANSKEGYEEYKEEAEILLEEAYRDKNNDAQRRLCVDTNSLAKRYIQKVLETKDEYKKHPFLHGIRMVLTKDTIIKNKDFFNSLFINHGIDYKI